MRLRDCSPFSRMKHPPSAVSSSWESIIQAPGSVRILQVSLSVFVHSCSRMVLRCTAPCLGAAGSMGSWCCGAHGWVLCLGGGRLLVPLCKHQLLPATCVPAIAVCLQELGWGAGRMCQVEEGVLFLSVVLPKVEDMCLRSFYFRPFFCHWGWGMEGLLQAFQILLTTSYIMKVLEIKE